MIFKQPCYLGKHVIHVCSPEFHAESNYDGLIAVQYFLHNLGDLLEQQRHGAVRLETNWSKSSVIHSFYFILQNRNKYQKKNKEYVYLINSNIMVNVKDNMVVEYIKIKDMGKFVCNTWSLARFWNRIQIYGLTGHHLNQYQLHEPGEPQKVHGDGVHQVQAFSIWTKSTCSFWCPTGS